MTNDEIKELLRDLAAKAEADGEVKSRTVRINFSGPREAEPADEVPVKKRRAEDSAAKEASGKKRHADEAAGKEALREAFASDAETDEPDREETDVSREKRSSGKKEAGGARKKGFFSDIKGKMSSWRQGCRTRRDVEEGISDVPLDQLPPDLAAKIRKEQGDLTPEEKKTKHRKAHAEDPESAGTPKEAAEAEADGVTEKAGTGEMPYRKPETGDAPADMEPLDEEFADAPVSRKARRAGSLDTDDLDSESDAGEFREDETLREDESLGKDVTSPDNASPVRDETSMDNASPLRDETSVDNASPGEGEPLGDDESFHDDASDREDDEPFRETEEGATVYRDPDEEPAAGAKLSEEGESGRKREKRRSIRPAAEPSKKAKPKRKIPTEAPDFESDAAEFRDTPALHDREEAALQERKGSIKHHVNDVGRSLKTRGIGRRQLIIIACVLAVVLLVELVALNVLGSRKKSALVTADDGLKISVEKEPAEWCRGGTVTLKFSCDSPMQTITINDVPTEITGNAKTTQITLNTDSDLLNIMVVTEDSVKNATVGLAKIDTEPPQIMVSAEEGQISLDASDNKSGLDGVYYGVKETTIEVPAYVPYEGPFEPESGKVYGYFAVDQAGNVTEPVITDLTPAVSLTLGSDQISLFPGESAQLNVQPEPANAFVNQLEIVSADPSVASVDERGVISALTDGETDITVSAQDLSSVTCHVTVRSSAEFTISTVGDVTLGEDINFSPLNSFSTVQTMYGDTYFFDNVRDILSSDDVTFANFEGTLTTANTRAEKQYAFRGDPSYTNILKDGSIEAVTLANNHSSDYGEQSLKDTQEYLTQAGIDWCSGDDFILKDYNGVKTALIGIYVLNEGEAKAEQVERTVAQAKEAGAQIVVVAFHWSEELQEKPDDTQKKLAHLAIDTGADLVVGHHPHVLQGIEKYSGKYICYSLANFCFGGNSNPSDKDTMIFQQTFRVLRGGEIESGEASVIPCSVSSTGDWNNYQPTPATGDEKERILQRINELCEPFGTSF